MTVGDDQLHAGEPTRLQGAEKILVGCLAFRVRYLHAEGLTHTVGGAHARDDQDPLAHHPPVRPYLLVAGVHVHVGVGVRLQRIRSGTAARRTVPDGPDGEDGSQHCEQHCGAQEQDGRSRPQTS